MINIKITEDKKNIRIIFKKFNYDVLDKIKSIQGRVWNPEDKSWRLPINRIDKLVEVLEGVDIEYETALDDIKQIALLQPSSEDVKTEDKAVKIYVKAISPTYIKTEDMVLSVFSAYDPVVSKELNTLIKSLGAKFNGDNKNWELKIEYLKDLKAFAKANVENNVELVIDKSVTKAVSTIKKDNKMLEESKNRDWDTIIDNYKFITKPFSYQLDGIRRGLISPSLLLTDEQGLGKTLQALYCADIKANTEGFKHVLIVACVNGLKYNWLAEIEEHLNQEGYILGSKINRNGRLVEGTIKERLAALGKIANNEIENRFIITNIETLRNDNIKAKIKELCLNGTIGLTIIDEIHKSSNLKSSQGDSLYSLKSRNKIGLTGTPVVNKPFDLYAPLMWLGAEKRSEYDFKQAYGNYIEKYGNGRYYPVLVGYKNLADLNKRLDTVMLRRTKEEVLDLPEVSFVKEFIDMDTKQNKQYEVIKKELVDKIDEIVLDPNPLSKFTRLRQTCTCPSAIDPEITTNPKYDRALELIQEAKEDGKKVIVYSTFAHAIHEFNRILNANNITTGIVVGETTNKKATIDKFQQSQDVLLGTTKALGTGFTITAASVIVFLDLPWTYADMIQAVDRCHRIGQNNNITVITLLAASTVDVQIFKIVKKKQDLFKDIVEGKDIKGVNRKKLTKRLLGI